MTKVCKKCGVEKSETAEFFRSNGFKGLRNSCRDCEAAARREYYAKNPEKHCEATRKWCRDNPEQHAATKRKWCRKNPDKIAAHHRKANYGLTDGDFKNLLELQQGGCAICGFVFPIITGDRKVSPHVDHCHTSGKIRGLLCSGCNTVLGRAKDSVHILEKAIQYLQKFSGSQK